MKNFLKIFLVLCLSLAILIPTWSVADVGDFESYDSDWGSSSYDSDWGSSSWDSDWDSDWGSSSSYYGSGSTRSSSSSDGDGIATVIAAVIIIAIIVMGMRGQKGGTGSTYRPPVRTTQNGYATGYVRNEARS